MPQNNHAALEKNPGLLADDHFIVSKGIAAIVDLEDDMKIVGTATNGEDALESSSLLGRTTPG